MGQATRTTKLVLDLGNRDEGGANNRKRANHLRGKINQYAREKAFAQGTCTVEVNPHGTSQYCSRCGARGERFSYRGGKRVQEKWGKLFGCLVCHYEAQADFNASVNVHRSFYREWHWQPRQKPPPRLPCAAAEAGTSALSG
jgi:transposase